QALGGSLYVSATVSGHPGLWKTDGTAAGTTLLLASSTIAYTYTDVGSLVFFTVGNTLWRTDGTAAGTSSVTAIGPDQSIPTDLTNVAGTLFFAADDGVHGTELWQSDGTAAGTFMVTDLFPEGSSRPESLTVVGNTLYFAADDGIHGSEPWRLQVP